MAQQAMPLKTVIRKVQSMVHDRNARNIVQAEKYSVHNVTWEDCARNKASVWGPCISDMTLQVGSDRMPVIRENNFTDTTWDVELEKIPIVVGNEIQTDSNNSNNQNKPKLTTVSLKEYLRNFDQYMSTPPKSNSNNNNNNNNVSFPMSAVNNLFEDLNSSNTINLLRKDETKDSHCIVSSQACFLPIESGKETLFNVALFNYQSKKQDPAILAIVATSKGTSAQIIEGTDQKLLFNNNGKKADFIGQRLTDNRIERGIKNLNAPMTTQEKQDNCIVIIQVPLKQKAKQYVPQYNQLFSDEVEESADLLDDLYGGFGAQPEAAAVPQMQSFDMISSFNSSNNSSNMVKRSLHKSAAANVESAIVKVAPKTHPVCKCGDNLEKLQLQFCYNNYGKPVSQMTNVNCDGCGKKIIEGATDEAKKTTIVWHCKKEKGSWQHKDGYDLCVDCAQKQLMFDELNGMNKIERDERYPIRVTLQYYKSTDNGVINRDIMKAISTQLKTSQKQSDYIGSLVTEYNSQRPTEWVKFVPFKLNSNLSVNQNYSLVRDVLGNLQLSQYFNNFVSNEISDARLMLLEESDLKLIFNKVGPLIVFRHWLRSYKGASNNNNNNGNDDQKEDEVNFGMGLFVGKN